MRVRKQLEGGLAVLSLVLGATPKGYSWKEQTHQEHLTAMAVELLELRYENKKQFSELYGDLIPAWR
jgi:hypothetical protein